MASAFEIVHRHVEAALAEAAGHSVPPETVASNLISEAVRILRHHRSPADIASELSFAIDNIEEQDFTFMRP